jgi:hypothetical protein
MKMGEGYESKKGIKNQEKSFSSFAISGFPRGVNEICALLGFHAA